MFGWEKVSCLERCPQFMSVLIERFHCITCAVSLLVYHCYQCLQISPLFKKNFALLQKFGSVFITSHTTKTSHLHKSALCICYIVCCTDCVYGVFSREKRHPYELLPTSYPLYPWLSPRPEHRPSPFRLSDGQSHTYTQLVYTASFAPLLYI